MRLKATGFVFLIQALVWTPAPAQANPDVTWSNFYIEMQSMRATSREATAVLNYYHRGLANGLQIMNRHTTKVAGNKHLFCLPIGTVVSAEEIELLIMDGLRSRRYDTKADPRGIPVPTIALNELIREYPCGPREQPNTVAPARTSPPLR